MINVYSTNTVIDGNEVLSWFVDIGTIGTIRFDIAPRDTFVHIDLKPGFSISDLKKFKKAVIIACVKVAEYYNSDYIYFYTHSKPLVRLLAEGKEELVEHQKGFPVYRVYKKDFS